MNFCTHTLLDIALKEKKICLFKYIVYYNGQQHKYWIVIWITDFEKNQLCYKNKYRLQIHNLTFYLFRNIRFPLRNSIVLFFILYWTCLLNLNVKYIYYDFLYRTSNCISHAIKKKIQNILTPKNTWFCTPNSLA